MILWLHAPIEVGCALVRDAKAHRSSFALTPEYLEMTERGIASAYWLHDPGSLDDDKLKQLNTEIMLQMQETGVAAVSDTTVHGTHCLRVAINNHRTCLEDLDRLVEETLKIGKQLH